MIYSCLIEHNEITKLPINKRRRYIYDILVKNGFDVGKEGRLRITVIKTNAGMFYQQIKR